MQYYRRRPPEAAARKGGRGEARRGTGRPQGKAETPDAQERPAPSGNRRWRGRSRAGQTWFRKPHRSWTRRWPPGCLRQRRPAGGLRRPVEGTTPAGCCTMCTILSMRSRTGHPGRRGPSGRGWALWRGEKGRVRMRRAPALRPEAAVRAGGEARVGLKLHNDAEQPARFSLVCTDLVSGSGYRILEGRVAFAPGEFRSGCDARGRHTAGDARGDLFGAGDSGRAALPPRRARDGGGVAREVYFT